MHKNLSTTTEKPCSHNSYVQSQFNGPHFFSPQLISSFLSDLSLTQPAESGGGGRLLCQLSRVTSALKPFGSKGNKLLQSSKYNDSLRENTVPCSKCTFAHSQPPLHHFTHIKSLPWEATATGQSDVSSHSCQRSLFIYPVILSIVDLVTWSESGRCRSTGSPESPVRTCWETRARDLSPTYIWTIPTLKHHCQRIQYNSYRTNN